jgi:hypothetical protein
MVKYDLIKELEAQGLLSECVSKGVISTTIPFHKIIYESYVRYRDDEIPKMMCYTLVAEDTGISEVTVIKIVADFRK